MRPFIAAVLLAAASHASAEPSPRVEDREAVALPRATMAELARNPAGLRRPEREKDHLRLPRTLGSAPAGETTAFATAGTAAPPPVVAGFAGAVEPPDSYPSDANGAVGPRHVVTAVNSGVVVRDRGGAKLSAVTLSQFWFDTGLPNADFYDPRAAYDASADRWVIAALSDINGKRSNLMIAVSTTSDPTGAWNRVRFTVDPNDSYAADFTRMALARDTIVISANMYTPTALLGSDLFLIPKNAAYLPTFDRFTVRQIHTPLSDIQPVANHDAAASAVYAAILVPDTSVTIFSIFGDGSLGLAAEASLPAQRLRSGPLPAGGAQLGSLLRLDLGFEGIYDAIERDGFIWLVATLYLAGPTRMSVLWYRLIPTVNPSIDATVVAKGLIDDPAGRIFYTYPSVAVNHANAAVVGYTTFAPDQFPSAGYMYIAPDGTPSALATLKQGEGRSRTARWGDYSCTVVDPANDTDFWSVQSYGVPSGLWAVWWGKIGLAPARTRSVHH